jgi:hypothetical protein
MIPHAPCMRCQWHRIIFNYFAYHRCFAYEFYFSKLFKNFGVNDTACIFKNLNICANSNLFSKRLWPLNQEPRTDVLMKKTEDRKSRDTVPLRFASNAKYLWRLIFLSHYHFASQHAYTLNRDLSPRRTPKCRLVPQFSGECVLPRDILP